jgi:hypothetical protein
MEAQNFEVQEVNKEKTESIASLEQEIKANDFEVNVFPNPFENGFKISKSFTNCGLQCKWRIRHD